ncbi:hypothetical protein ACNQR7_32250 [Mycolicibacterium senegalense]|uniref:hypothetical protein n=1 Tax=Mycolicibacterium senegalense TaxID=1796 RepID=UPI003AAA4CF3
MTQREAPSADLPARVPVAWTRTALERFGFEGFVPFSALSAATVANVAGVYCVLRVADGPPTFLETSPAGRVKGRDQTVSVAELERLWVPGAAVVYIGKAQLGSSQDRGLLTRLVEFRKFGAGQLVPHTGGRRIWQLADSSDLLVGWMATDDSRAVATEELLLKAFTSAHGRLPFANMR